MILALNYFTLVFLTMGVSISLLCGNGLLLGMLCFMLWFYLVPPLLSRLTILAAGKPSGLFTPESPSHTLWWWLFQLQLPFNRFPFFEELLRSVPGLYALWLNLWGSRVSLFAFWGPGVTVMERYHLHIGKGVILGTQSFLSGHVIHRKPDGSTLLLVDSIHLEQQALIGARASVAPGCHIHQGETVPFNTVLRPYTEIEDGKKRRLREISELVASAEQ